MENLQPNTVTGPITTAEREYAIQSLQTTQANLHQSLAGLSSTQLTFKPSADRWSIAECAEHIALVETGIFAAIQVNLTTPADLSKRTQIQVSDIDVIKAVRSRSVTLAAPTPFVPTGRFENLTATLQAFDNQRSKAIEFIKTTPSDVRAHYFKHIALGLLDTYQAILLMAAHTERHRKQIEEIKADPGFPQ